MTTDETQIQIFADWPMSHCKTLDKRTGQQEKSRISCHCRAKETADRQQLSAEKQRNNTLETLRVKAALKAVMHCTKSRNTA